jgi:hypothetical protein
VTISANSCVPDGRGRYMRIIDPGCTSTATVVRLDWMALIWQAKDYCNYNFNVHSQTYIVGSDGDCQPVSVPANFASLHQMFSNNDPMQRAKASFSPLLGGQYKISWFAETSYNCEPAALQFSIGSKLNTCSKFGVSTGNYHLSLQHSYATAVVRAATPSLSPTPQPASGGQIRASGARALASSASALVAALAAALAAALLS